MNLPEWLQQLLYPPKCVFCRTLLRKGEADLCGECRRTLPYYEGAARRAPYSRGTTAVFYYKGHVRESILRFKFGRMPHYADAYGRLLAEKLRKEPGEAFDCITYVPVSRRRERERGYDQAELLAQAAARELQLPLQALLQKHRDVPAQSGISEPERRRANVLGVYSVPDLETVRDKQILLIDDVMTTGATLAECTRTLLEAGARDVFCAVLASASRTDKKSR